jgi:DNA-binding transcriptional MerR regulator
MFETMETDLLHFDDGDLDALCERAATVLARTGAGSADARVREVPDGRTVRYYQSSGLLDRPVGYDGRRAIYGRRHLLQMVCIKLLQARGLSLAQVQQALAGAPTAQLEAAAREALASPPSTSMVARPPSRPLPGPASSGPAWVARELEPGLLVSVDPRRHPDPEAVMRRLAAALSVPVPSTPTGESR